MTPNLIISKEIYKQYLRRKKQRYKKMKEPTSTPIMPNQMSTVKLKKIRMKHNSGSKQQIKKILMGPSTFRLAEILSHSSKRLKNMSLRL